MSYKKLVSAVGEKFLGWYDVVLLKDVAEEFSHLYGDEPFPSDAEVIDYLPDENDNDTVIFKGAFAGYVTNPNLRLYYGVMAVDEGVEDDGHMYQPICYVIMIVPENGDYNDMTVCDPANLLECISEEFLSEYMSGDYLEKKNCVIICDHNPY